MLIALIILFVLDIILIINNYAAVKLFMTVKSTMEDLMDRVEQIEVDIGVDRVWEEKDE